MLAAIVATGAVSNRRCGQVQVMDRFIETPDGIGFVLARVHVILTAYVKLRRHHEWRNRGIQMKKIALMVLVGLIAATPAGAASKKKAKKMHAAAAAQPVNPNDAGFRLVRDSLPSLMPTALKVIYFSQPENKKQAEHKKKK
jgi:hypothetical protein